ncbi:MAG: 2-oxo acid dehydrogenase subunit E2 [Planctomycetes bacterium]|nr:2-oxo acid dehydrogenase subunit E2 [Planctomycetota bacterium]
MKSVSGRSIPLSAPRRMVSDLLHISRQIPLIPGERTMQLAKVVEARKAATPRPSWLAMFVKALATVTAKHPEARRVFLTRPWHRMYEYNENIVSVVVERDYHGEPGLFLARLHSPEKMSLTEIDAQIRKFKEKPIEEISAFQNALRLARMPLFLRRGFWSLVMNWMPKLRAKFLGNLGISLTAGMGGVALSLLTPWTFTIFYDAFEDDGSLTFRVMFDHRILDGRMVCRMGRELEQEMNGSILEEVRAMKSAETTQRAA